MKIELEVEDNLKDIIESPGAFSAIQTAVLQTILRLQEAYWQRRSKAAPASSFRGVNKEGV